jgi:hypothetical protein
MDVEGFVQHVETCTEFLSCDRLVKIFYWENKQGKKHAKKMVLLFIYLLLIFFFTKMHCTPYKFSQF